jgi:AmmeMemoRadiSam system protein B
MKPYPRVRPVEAFPIEHGGHQLILMHDPTGFADGPITVSPAALFLILMLDGQKGPDELQKAFREQFGQSIDREQIEELISQLDAAKYLDSETFARHYQSLVDDYRAAPARLCRDLEVYGIDAGAVGADGTIPGSQAGETKETAGRRRAYEAQVADLRSSLTRMISQCRAGVVGKGNRRLAGLIAPHLDYPRGEPCYADAYGLLASTGIAPRVVILGTNHYGRGTSVVATSKDFQTPLGTTRTARCGADLCAHEFDHSREHSVELQVVLLQHLFGADAFQIVPVLCHDPCGPTGTKPYDGQGVDLRVFGEALGELIRSDRVPTLIIAGADLSHVGRRFGDDCELEPTFLSTVERQDREAIEEIVNGRPDEFVRVLAGRENATRVCSAGCIYALRVALDGAEGELLRYHQAIDAPNGTGVTCCAAAFWA